MPQPPFATAPIHAEAFETILQRAIVRPAGRQFRGEPARQLEILRRLRTAAGPVGYDELHAHLRTRGVLRSERDDDASRRKAIRQAVEAINAKLGTFFFQASEPELLEEMFRIRSHGADSGRPAYSLQDFFEVRKLSGVTFYSTTSEPSGGVTRELFEMVSETRPRRLDMMSPSLESLFGNPEFRSMLRAGLQSPDARVRLLLLDPDSAEALRLERPDQEPPGRHSDLRERIRATLRHAEEIRAGLPEAARERFGVRLSPLAPLWRFRMIFLPDVLNLRLSAPDHPGQTLIKLGRSSALYASLHDVFERQWEEAAAA